MDTLSFLHGTSMAKRPCCSDPPMVKTSSTMLPQPDDGRSHNDTVLESILSVSDIDSISTSFDSLIDSRSSDSDQNDLIQRALHLGSVLLEAGKRSDRKRSSAHNAVVWPLPPDLTIKVFALLDTQSVCYVAATCSFFQKCAADPLCFANIDLVTLVPKVNNAVVSSMIKRAGNALQSIKLGVLPPSASPLFSSSQSQPLVYSIRNSTDTSGVSWNDKRSRQGKESSILTRSCLSSLSGNGAPGARLRRLHLFNIERMDNTALLSALSACPSLLDLEIVGLHVELRHTLEAVSKHCPLLDRLVFESSKAGRDDGLKYPTCNEFVHNCPNITSLALKGFKLHDYKVRMLVKGFRKLKYVDFSTSYSFTGVFLRNLGGCGTHLEVMILRDCMHLKDIEVERLLGAIMAGEFKRFRHLDISNREGLASDGDWYHRCYSVSFIPIKQLLEERPNFCLVAEFPNGSYVDDEQATTSDLNSDMSLPFPLNCHASDGLIHMSTSDNSSDSDQGSGNEDGRVDGFVLYEESSDEVEFLSEVELLSG